MLAAAANFQRAHPLRTVLVLGRVSNLPTVWSNCLAGWLLAGSGEVWRFGALCAGATLLYIGGMFLNDAFDAQFDRQHRRERPIPAGAITEAAVWKVGFFSLALGIVLLSILGKTTAILALLLAGAIIVYDAIHKIFAFSPLLMAVCRFYLFLAAAAVGADGVTGLAIWSGMVLGLYIAGLSFLARRESTGVTIQYWPSLFLALPLILATVVNSGEYRLRSVLISALFLPWVFRCLRLIFWTQQRNISRGVSGLLAGIVLVDWLAAGPGVMALSPLFAGLFVMALVFQRFAPAT